MANEYADLSVLKTSLGLEDDDDSRDVLLAAALASASRSIDTACGRRFWLDAVASARTYNPEGRTVYDGSGTRLLIDDAGAEPTLVETGSAGSWSVVTGYETGPENALSRGRPITSLLLPSGGWGTRVRVTTPWGWPTFPDEIVQATVIQASRLFKRKDSPEGVTGSAEWGVVRLSRRDPDVWALIEHYVLPGFG
ncbi:phage gp6-like head-tail connector protein [Streptomyces sp. NBC_01264]|uniref:phage gp6-like head-tail connector protein n=1 Tax=Streptomyces sp. NBC_01264 TaxID=2903804 RepID=UPI002254B7B0|nr:phage gp6-like head-tail connector protein [Streptomyces sp. NBC_01264]MCX4780059.1 phage gp6-like head-tail connector protein [Streptomyces sp. NBC_01264]